LDLYSILCVPIQPLAAIRNKKPFHNSVVTGEHSGEQLAYF